MPNLRSIRVTFRTHNDNLNPGTIVHVFVKNRSNTTSTPESNTTFIANHLAYEHYEQRYPSYGPYGINPYLGRAENVFQSQGLEDPSTVTIDLSLRSQPIPLEEVVLPVVNIHIMPDYSNALGAGDRWIFSYTIVFTFDDGHTVFSFASDTDGVTGIILSENERDYSGICAEIRPLQPFVKPDDLGAVLVEADLEFWTHSDDDKLRNTQLNVHIVNRVSASSNQDIAIGVDLFPNQPFASNSSNRIVFSGAAGAAYPLAPRAIRLRDMVLPVVNINIVPTGYDRWPFHYVVTYWFSNGQSFSSSSLGIILDQDNHKHTGVYNGPPFPTVTPPSRPTLSSAPVNHVYPNDKKISLRFLQKKIDEFINHRQGVGSQDPPLKKIRLHNTGVYGRTRFDGGYITTLPDTYVDLASIAADPPRPGTTIPASYKEPVRWDSSPSSFGQLPYVYFNDINATSVNATIDATQAIPIVVRVDFETDGIEVFGALSMDFARFSVVLGLTLTVDHDHGKIDVLSWVDELDGRNLRGDLVLGSNPPMVHYTGTFAGQPVDATVLPNLDAFMDTLVDKYVVHVVVEGSGDTGIVQKHMRQKLRDRLKAARDSVNAQVNSWLLGGVLQQDNPNGCRVQSTRIDGDDLGISYRGPANTFVPPRPLDWPAGHDFTPGTLANIDHIVVLTMENRSFDHMLGYLSLPLAKGGLGRTDVDGLKGGEFNTLNGATCPSFPFSPGDTIFSPDPPHDPEPVARAINSGRMDGFVRSYAEESGVDVAPRIMGYHTGVNVPVYDALARDFAIAHRWFASHPGSTFPNRFYELTGRLNIDPDGFWETTNRTVRPVFTKTIFDYLSDKAVSWNYFEHGYCFLRFFEQHTFDPTNIITFDDPVNGFVNLAKTGRLPSVSFIDPHFIELPPNGNCDGPPADIKEGQALVKKVVEAVVTSPQWNKTLLLIVYDEHGGFFDHVSPPPATKVSPDSSIATYGVRVPAFVISPWVKAGAVFGKDGLVDTGGGGDGGGGQSQPSSHGAPSGPVSLYFDHTSILKTISKRFLSADPPYMGARFAAARDLSSVIGSHLRTSKFLPFIPYHLLYTASKKRLDVPGGSSSPGTGLWQYDPNDTPAQQFSFEDAGGGLVYIRTHTGNLYMTVDIGLPAMPKQPPGIKEDIKYTGASGLASQNPNLQHWKVTPSGFHGVNQFPSYTISNAAFPGKVLQPAGGGLSSGTPVILGDPAGTKLLDALKTAWGITSPLLPADQSGDNTF